MSVIGMFQQLAQQCRHLARRSYSRKLLRGTRFESSSALGRAVQRSVPYSKEFRALSFYVGMYAVIPTTPLMSVMAIYRQLTLRAAANLHAFIDLPEPRS
jgi:hypothetical protein